MRILLSDVRDCSRDFQFEEPLALESLAERAEAGQVRVQVHVNPAGERWYVSGQVEGSFPLVCDRCGSSFTGELVGRFDLVVLGRAVAGLDPEESDEVLILPGSSAELDIGDKVREVLLLDLPMRLLCKENCAGLCPRCGANLNETSCGCGETEGDSRWSALADLKQLMEQKNAGEESGAGESED